MTRNTWIDQALRTVQIESVSIKNLIISIFLEIIGLGIDLLFDIQSVFLLENHVIQS